MYTPSVTIQGLYIILAMDGVCTYLWRLREGFTEKQVFAKGEGKKKMKTVFQCMCYKKPVFTDYCVYIA